MQLIQQLDFQFDIQYLNKIGIGPNTAFVAVVNVSAEILATKDSCLIFMIAPLILFNRR